MHVRDARDAKACTAGNVRLTNAIIIHYRRLIFRLMIEMNTLDGIHWRERFIVQKNTFRTRERAKITYF